MTSWTFLTNQALVLIHIGRRPDSTGLEIAAAVGITERAVRKIVVELQAAGYLEAERIGRRNRYSVDVHRPLRNSAEPQLTIGELLALVRTGTGSVRGGSPTAGRRPMNGEPLEAGSSQLEGVDS